MRNYVDEIEATPLDALMAKASPDVRAALKRSLNAPGTDAPRKDCCFIPPSGDDLRAVVKCADLARAEDVGDEVTYVVNRNINFTNICFVGCQFCGFKRQRWESDAYDHSDETILAKVGDAVARGATEVCMQGGINPDMPDFKYRDLLRAIKGALSRDSHPRVLADGDHVRRAARRGWNIRSISRCCATPASARFPAPPPKSSTTASARS